MHLMMMAMMAMMTLLTMALTGQDGGGPISVLFGTTIAIVPIFSWPLVSPMKTEWRLIGVAGQVLVKDRLQKYRVFGATHVQMS